MGRFAGKEGLTTIDAIYSLLKLPVNFFVGLSTGATILVLQRQAGKGADQSCAYRCGFALVGGAVLSATGMAAAPICLRLMAVPVFGDEIMVIVASCPVPWILAPLLFIVYRWRKGEAMFCAPAFEKGKEKAA